MNSNALDAPVVLVSRVSLARGASQPLNFAAMANRSRGWLEVNEIAFTIDPGFVNGRSGPNGITPGDQYGGLITVDCGVGRHRMTNGQVPVWLLGPRLSYYGELGQQSYLAGPDQGLGQTCFLPVINCYTWKLPKPMLVPPGTSMGMLLSRPSVGFLDPGTGAIPFPNPMTVEVAVKGKRLAKAPRVRETDVPYATYFATNPLDTVAQLAECGQGFATGNSLANPFAKPLMVERFTQRTAMGAPSGTFFYAADFQGFTANAGNNNAPTAGNPSNLRLRIFQNHYEVMSETNPKPQVFSNASGSVAPLDNPQGKALIDSVFNPQFATWRIGQELASKEWFNAEFSANATFVGTLAMCQPAVAMIASRREGI